MLDVCRPWAGDALPAPTSYDALLVLGGEMGANDDADVPWLAAAQGARPQAARSATPTLGICLGHQVIAVALGGEVRRNPRGQAVGVLATGWTTARADDPLTAGLAGARGIQWNNDVVTRAPEGAVVLAESAAGELQAARFAAGVWGVQLHPEAAGRSCAPGPRATAPTTSSAASTRTPCSRRWTPPAAELDAAWRPLAHRFAELAALSGRPSGEPGDDQRAAGPLGFRDGAAALAGIEELGDAGVPLTAHLAATADPDAALAALLRLADEVEDRDVMLAEVADDEGTAMRLCSVLGASAALATTWPATPGSGTS